MKQQMPEMLMEDTYKGKYEILNKLFQNLFSLKESILSC